MRNEAISMGFCVDDVPNVGTSIEQNSNTTRPLTKYMKQQHSKYGQKHLFRSSFFLAIFFVFSAHSEGFRNPPPDTFSLGRAGGRITHVEGAAAIQQNPANLVSLTNTQFEFTPSVVYIHADYESALGKAKTTDPWKALPNAYIAFPLMNNRVVAGLGLTSPYGLSNEWERDGAFADPAGLRYLAPWYTELKTINANPAAAVRLSDRISLGVGLDVMWSQLTFKQFYPWAPWGSMTEGNVKAQGDGIGVGGNIGLTWQVADHHRLSITYRSPISIDYQGDFTINNIPDAATGAGVTPRSDFSSKIKFPTIVAVGYGVEVTDTLRLEVAGEWLQFSNFESLGVNVANNNVLLPSTSIPQNWQDTFTVGLGGDWTFSPDWVFRFGYQYYESPVPDSTLSTTIPDANQNVFTVGLGYHHGRHSFEAAYGLDFYDKRTVPSGTYDITVHLFSAAYRVSF